MSETLQFRHHPDADQISAFVESALPAHEREQVLGHLGACPDCRAIVALSLPEVEEPQQAPAPLRKPWWSGWAIAWPLAGALAATVFLVVHYSQLAHHERSTQQIAVERPPVGLNSPVSPPASQSPARGLQTQSTDNSQGTGAGVEGLSVTGRNTAALERISPARSASRTQFQDQAAKPASGALGAAAGGMLAAPAPANDDRLQAASQAQPSGNAVVELPRAKAVTETTVNVAADAAMPTEAPSVSIASIEVIPDQAMVAQLKHPLPSRLPVLSVAVQARLVVAIDAASGTFLSKDEGKHWRAIRAPWQGRAMKASLVETPGRSLPTIRLDQSSIAGAYAQDSPSLGRNVSGALAAKAPAPAAPNAPSVTGTVTDMSGAVVPGASVIVTEIATGTAHRVTTDAAGHYAIDGLSPGTYQVQAQAQGFEKQEIAAVVVPAAGQSTANLSLPVGASSQTVTVTAEAGALSTSDKKAKRSAPNQPAPVFEITTDNGERWTSTDGSTWTRK